MLLLSQSRLLPASRRGRRAAVQTHCSPRPTPNAAAVSEAQTAKGKGRAAGLHVAGDVHIASANINLHRDGGLEIGQQISPTQQAAKGQHTGRQDNFPNPCHSPGASTTAGPAAMGAAQHSTTSVAPAVVWMMLYDITEAGKDELQAAGLSAGTALHLQALGYTQPGDLQYVRDEVQSLCKSLPPIQAAKLSKLAAETLKNSERMATAIKVPEPPASKSENVKAVKTVSTPETEAADPIVTAASAPLAGSDGSPAAPASSHQGTKLLSPEVFAGVRWLWQSPLNSHVQQLLWRCGGVPGLVAMLAGPASDAQAQAAWALGSLAGSGSYRTMVLAAGAVYPLVEILVRGSPEVQVQAAYTLGNLADGSKQASELVVATAGEDGVPTLMSLLSRPDHEAQRSAAWAIKALATYSVAFREKAAITGVVEKLELLMPTLAVATESSPGKTPAHEYAAHALLLLKV